MGLTGDWPRRRVMGVRWWGKGAWGEKTGSMKGSFRN